jgi:hypothetical protein
VPTLVAVYNLFAKKTMSIASLMKADGSFSPQNPTPWKLILSPTVKKLPPFLDPIQMNHLKDLFRCSLQKLALSVLLQNLILMLKGKPISSFQFLTVLRGSNIRRRLFDEDPGEVSVNVQLQQLRLKMARKLCSQVSSIASARAEDAVPYPAVSLSPPTTRNKTKASDAKPTTSLPKPQPLAELKRSQLDPPVPIVKRRYCEDQNTQQQAMAYRASQKPLMRTSRIESTEAVRVVVPSPVKGLQSPFPIS